MPSRAVDNSNLPDDSKALVHTSYSLALSDTVFVEQYVHSAIGNLFDDNLRHYLATLPALDRSRALQ